MTDDEKLLLTILRRMYWESQPNARCQNPNYIKSHWPGAPSTIGALNNAVQSLVASGHLKFGDLLICLTDTGLREIGVLPPEANGASGAA